MKVLWKYFKGYEWVSILGPTFKLVEAILELLIPMLVAKIIDQGVIKQDARVIMYYVLWMIGLGIVGFIFSISAQYFSAKSAIGFTRQLSNDLFKKVMRLPKATIESVGASSLMTRMTSDTVQIQTGINIVFRLVMRSPFIVFGSFIMAMRINHQVSLYFLLMIVILFVVTGTLVKVTDQKYRTIRQKIDYLTKLTTQQVKGIRVIRAFRQEKRELDEFKQENNTLYQQSVSVANWSALVNPLTYSIVNIMLVVVLSVSSRYVNLGILLQGDVVALINYLLAILVELLKLTMVIITVNKSWVSAQRVADILQKSDEAEQFDNGKLAVDNIALVFDKVTFTYPEDQNPVLKQLDFHMENGKNYGIVGSTGAGKSTVLELLMKVVDPTGGTISFNSDLMDVSSRKEIRNVISLVPQKATLLQGTIKSNLLLAYPEATEEEMWRALEVAQAADFLREKEGLETKVSAFGDNFSGGQRQRLTIARALVKPALIYVFDDSTSALDYLTEMNFLRDLKSYLKDKMIIMISQRTHSMTEMDRILVLNEGVQLGFDTHEQLLKSNQVYREIYDSQQIKGGD